MLIVIRIRETESHGDVPADVRAAAEPFGETLRPMHPAASDPSSAGYFTISVPDADAANRILARLRNCRSLDAAYVKPPDALP